MANLSDDREVGGFFHILAAFNLVVEEVDQEQDEGGNQQSEDDANQIVHHVFRSHSHGALRACIVDHLIVSRVGGLDDLGFGSALHQIVVGFLAEGKAAFVTNQQTFFLREVAGLVFDLSDTGFDVVDAQLGIGNQVVDVFKNGLLGGDDLLIEFYDDRVLVGDGQLLEGLLLVEVDQVLHQFVQQRVVDAHGRRCGEVVGIVDVSLHVGLQPFVVLHVHHPFGVLLLQLLEGVDHLCRLGVDVGQVVRGTELLQVDLGTSQVGGCLL